MTNFHVLQFSFHEQKKTLRSLTVEHKSSFIQALFMNISNRMKRQAEHNLEEEHRQQAEARKMLEVQSNQLEVDH